MPPPDRAQPDADAVAAVVAWIDAELGTGRPDPGRVTIRRLNRTEYRNTVRDLLGVHYDTDAHLPADDVGYGFDNIGDVLSLPPALLEKYLAAAEAIAARAVVDEDPAHPPVHRVAAGELTVTGGGSQRGGAAWLHSSGMVGATHRFPRDGEYVLRARAWGQQAGPDPVRMAFRAGRANLGVVAVPATAPTTYEVRARVKAGTHGVGVVFTNDYYRPDHPDPKQRDRNMAVEWLEIVGPVDAPVVADAQRRLVPRPPSAEPAAAAAYLREVAGAFLARAWRRPLRDGELDRLLAAVEAGAAPGATFHARLRLAVTAALVSPHFLFRVELDPEAAADAWRVGDFELASRLSYFLWSSMPDDELFALARRGELARDDVLAGQVRRMLRDPRASELSRNFAAQWLHLRGLDEAAPDPERFPGVDDALLDAMRAETELFFEAVLREDRSVWDFLDGDFTFLNEKLAKHYGIEGVKGDRMRRVRLDGTRRAGVLTQASVLTVTSNPDRTSPVKRGKWILEALLDAPPPPPPPGVGTLEEVEAAQGATMRERLALHRADPNCASCHVRMDVLGLGLENFDAVGRWRTHEGARPVEAGGTLPDGRSFDDPAGLRAILRADPAFLRSLSRHLLTFALGRGLTDGDEAAVRDLVAALEREPTLKRLILGIVRLDAFRMKRSDKVTTK
jgi:hypothetical protein